MGVWRNVSAKFPSPVGEGQGEGIRPHQANFVGRVSAAATRHFLMRPPVPPGFFRTVQRRIGTGDDLGAR